MFKGIVESVGLVTAVVERESARRMRFEAAAILDDLAIGDSVAVDGACLTVTELDETGFSVDVIGTTLARTVAGRYEEGSSVNLERALRFSDRIDGHLVQGHVDGVADFIKRERDGTYWLMDFALPSEVAAQTIGRGSITLNGVSLTVAELTEGGRCRIGVIPFTFDHTNLGLLEPGDRVNVEGDLIGKYVGKMMAERDFRGA